MLTRETVEGSRYLYFGGECGDRCVDEPRSLTEFHCGHTNRALFRFFERVDEHQVVEITEKLNIRLF